MSKSVVFALGGTGGHLIPAQVTAQRLSSADSTLSVQFVGHGLSSSRLIDRSQFDTYDVLSATFSWKKPLKAIRGIYRLTKGIWQAYHFLKQRKPQLVVGFGSYHSFPVLFAAFLRKIPIVLHESNVKPGRVNRFFARFAKAMVIAYAETRRYIKAPILHLKMPLRYEENSAQDKELAYKEYGFNPDILTILVWGGSLGAGFLNRIVPEAIEMLADQGVQLQVIHLCGHNASPSEIEMSYKRAGIHAIVKKFEKHMHHAFAIADFAVSRSGAMTLAEAIEHELPSIMIPFAASMENHQDVNADFFVEQVAGGQKIKEDLASAEKLLSIMTDWVEEDCVRLHEYKQHIQEFKKSMPLKTFEEYIREYL